METNDPMNMHTVRIGVIGVGHLGSIHAKLWNQTERADLIGVYDVDNERAATTAELYNCTAYTSLDDMWTNVDAVTISAPTSNHYALARESLANGKHCFIEKPITSTYAEACELINVARDAQKVIQVGHVERFNPVMKAMHGYPLAPMFIEAHRLAQFKPRATDVSVVLDLMIHDIDIILALVQSTVESIDASGVAVLTDSPDIANARIRFKNGCVANITASRISQKQLRKMRLFQKDAYISLDFGSATAEVFRLTDEDGLSAGAPALMLGKIDAGTGKRTILFEKPAIPEGNAIQMEQQAFVDSILHAKPVEVTASEAAEALRIAEEISKMIT